MNTQREAFKGKVAEHMKSSGGAETSHAGGGQKSESRVEHHGDGTHTVHHADGEKSGPHPSMAHAAMHMAGKHDGGEHGHITPHPGGGATTNHVGMDGQVQGPHDHEAESDGYSHLQGSIGEGSEGGEMMPEGGAAMGGDGQEESSFE